MLRWGVMGVQQCRCIEWGPGVGRAPSAVALGLQRCAATLEVAQAWWGMGATVRHEGVAARHRHFMTGSLTFASQGRLLSAVSTMRCTAGKRACMECNAARMPDREPHAAPNHGTLSYLNGLVPSSLLSFSLPPQQEENRAPMVFKSASYQLWSASIAKHRHKYMRPTNYIEPASSGSLFRLPSQVQRDYQTSAKPRYTKHALFRCRSRSKRNTLRETLVLL